MGDMQSPATPLPRSLAVPRGSDPRLRVMRGVSAPRPGTAPFPTSGLAPYRSVGSLAEALGEVRSKNGSPTAGHGALMTVLGNVRTRNAQ